MRGLRAELAPVLRLPTDRALAGRDRADPLPLRGGLMALTHGLILGRNSTESATPGSILMTFIRALLAAGGKKR